jgi:putative transposase
MILEYELKAEHVREYTMKTLREHITLEANGYRCTPEMILDVILKASAEGSSIEASCGDLEEVADSNTIRDYLNNALDIDKLREQEAEINAALADHIPPGMKRENLEVAVDFHDEPFYGKRPELLDVTCRGRAKAGSTHFVRIATCYVIWRQVRLTLAVRYVLPDDEKLAIVQFLLQRLKTLGFTFKVLYMDKGFASGDVITYLTEQKQPALIACPIRGKQGGTKALCKGRKSYRTDYTFTDGTEAHLAMIATLVPDKTGKRRRKWLAFIVIELDWVRLFCVGERVERQ